jgi:hypothetical protein
MEAYRPINSSIISIDPQTGGRVFLQVKISTKEPVTKETEYIPVDIKIYSIKINYPTLIGYICFFLGALAPFSVSPIVPSLVVPFFTIALAGLGAALVLTQPRLLEPGELLKTLHDFIDLNLRIKTLESFKRVRPM